MASLGYPKRPKKILSLFLIWSHDITRTVHHLGKISQVALRRWHLVMELSGLSLVAGPLNLLKSPLS